MGWWRFGERPANSGPLLLACLLERRAGRCVRERERWSTIGKMYAQAAFGTGQSRASTHTFGNTII